VCEIHIDCKLFRGNLKVALSELFPCPGVGLLLGNDCAEEEHEEDPIVNAPWTSGREDAEEVPAPYPGNINVSVQRTVEKSEKQNWVGNLESGLAQPPEGTAALTEQYQDASNRDHLGPSSVQGQESIPGLHLRPERGEVDCRQQPPQTLDPDASRTVATGLCQSEDEKTNADDDAKSVRESTMGHYTESLPEIIPHCTSMLCFNKAIMTFVVFIALACFLGSRVGAVRTDDCAFDSPQVLIPWQVWSSHSGKGTKLDLRGLDDVLPCNPQPNEQERHDDRRPKPDRMLLKHRPHAPWNPDCPPSATQEAEIEHHQRGLSTTQFVSNGQGASTLRTAMTSDSWKSQKGSPTAGHPIGWPRNYVNHSYMTADTYELFTNL
jgi:hypothetical protein